MSHDLVRREQGERETGKELAIKYQSVDRSQLLRVILGIERRQRWKQIVWLSSDVHQRPRTVTE